MEFDIYVQLCYWYRLPNERVSRGGIRYIDWMSQAGVRKDHDNIAKHVRNADIARDQPTGF
jgi:hypothetical protein